MNALVRTSWLDRLGAETLIDQAAAEIERTQQRNARARKSHTKTTWKRLRRLGITRQALNRCEWDNRTPYDDST